MVLLLFAGTASAADPIGYYELDSDATDSIGSNDGAIYNDVSFMPGYLNNSSLYDGGYIIIDDVFETNATSNFTFSCWINIHDGIEGDSCIFSQSRDATSPLLFLEIQNTKPRIFIRNDAEVTEYGQTYNFIFQENIWYNIILSKNADEILLYIDGVEIEPPNNGYNYGSISTYERMTFGAVVRSAVAALPIDGEIDDVKLYNVAFSEAEALNLYQNSIHNSFIISSYDELNETQLNISSFNLFNEHETITEGTLLDSKYIIYSDQLTDNGQFILTINVDDYYPRKFIVENEYKPVTVSTYLPPESATVIYNQFTLNNYIATYDASDIILRLDKPMANETNTIYSSFFDLNSLTSTYLIPTDAYILYIVTPAETINYGWLFADADGETTILLNDFEFSETNEWLSTTYTADDTAVSFDYSASKAVSSATFDISFTNESAVYSAETEETDTGSFTYNFLVNGTYIINIAVNAADGDTYTKTEILEVGDVTTRDFFPTTYSATLKAIIVIFAIIIGVLALSSYRADLSAIWIFGLYAFAVSQSWLPGNAITIAIIGIIAAGAIKKFQKKESRT